VSAVGGQAVSGALVELLGPGNARADATLTADDGTFLLRAPTAGTYRIRLRRIGFETWSSGEIAVDGDVTLRLEIPVAPIALAEMNVRATRLCRTPADDARRAWQRYQQAVELLEPIAWSETGFTSIRSSWRSRSRLRFEPVPGRDTPDVEGVLWMDPEAREPRFLEFEFTRIRSMLEEYQLPPLMADVHRRLAQDPRVDGYVVQLGQIVLDDAFGGRLVFDRLANGSWITRSWELRIPILGEASRLDWTRTPARLEGSLVAIAKTRTGRVTAVMAPAPSGARDTARTPF